MIVHKGMIVLSKRSPSRTAARRVRVGHAYDLDTEAELTSAATIGHMRASA
jgi:hypothetical protein